MTNIYADINANNANNANQANNANNANNANDSMDFSADFLLAGGMPDLSELSKVPEQVMLAMVKQMPKVLGLEPSKDSKPDDEAILAFIKKLKSSAKAASSASNLTDALKELSKSGLKVEVTMSDELQKSFGVKERSFDWMKLAKWIGGGAALIAVSYCGYKIYTKWRAAEAADSVYEQHDTPGIVIL